MEPKEKAIEMFQTYGSPGKAINAIREMLMTKKVYNIRYWTAVKIELTKIRKVATK